MMPVLLLLGSILLFASYSNGLSFILIMLGAVLAMFALEFRNLSYFDSFLITSVVFAVPMTGFLVGTFLDRYVSKDHKSVFSTLALGLSLLFVFRSGYLLDLYATALGIISRDLDSTSSFAFLTAVGTMIFSISAAISIFYISSVFVFEMVFVLITKNKRKMDFVSFSSLRSLALIFFISVTTNVVIGFIDDKFTKATFLSLIK